jgi:hypothetical protein
MSDKAWFKRAMSMRSEGRAIARAFARLLLVVAALLALQCQTSRDEPTGGETHFLQRCSDSAADCGPGLLCACGACTLACTEAAACGSFANASCVSPENATCSAPGASYCEVTCGGDQDCAPLSSAHRCTEGTCRSGGPTPSACAESDRIEANQLVVLGDSFFAANHSVTAFLEDLARSHGSISLGERYRDYSNVVGNTLALLGPGITNQYTAAEAESPVRVVLMTGGGADVLLGSCELVSDTCPLLTAAAMEATALFQRMSEDGVEHVVYAYYPDPSDADLRAEVGALRPLLERACRESPVPCAWVDLRPVFEGHEDAYLDAEGTVPTADGARAAALELWSVMSAACIGQ